VEPRPTVVVVLPDAAFKGQAGDAVVATDRLPDPLNQFVLIDFVGGGAGVDVPHAQLVDKPAPTALRHLLHRRHQLQIIQIAGVY